jgi:DNA-binding beta-propeller fold protein YncE
LGSVLLAVCGLAGVASSAQGAASDPLFVFVPKPAGLNFVPPPTGFLEGPCGVGVDPLGHFYVSDYYHDTIDVYDQNANYADPKATGATGFLGQLPGIDPADGPCGLSFGASNLFVNDYHRAVLRYDPLGSSGTITGATTPEETHPTGVAADPATGNVYVDQRTYVSVFEESGAAVMEGPPGSEVPVQIAKGPLEDGYGIAFSQFPGTAGHLYVSDAATNTIEVYDTATPNAGPVQVIDGSETPKGKFVSLTDASVAVDRVTGEIYVIDNLQPKYTERPQAIAYVFHPDGTYEGHLKFPVTWAMPVGLAVDNSETATQGRVYLTSGNSAFGAIYAYGPGSATTAPFGAAVARLALTSAGPGDGTIQSSLGASCASACEEEVPAGASVTLTADPAPGSSFAGFSGACGGTGTQCVVQVDQAAAVRATFNAPAPQEPQQGATEPSAPSAAPLTATAHHPRRHHRKAHRHRHHRVKRAR